MSRNKTPGLKARLGKKLKQNRRIPVFVIAKTKRKLTTNTSQRNWRTKKLKMKEE